MAATPIPTTPSIEHSLRQIAENSNQGLPIWQVLLGLLAVGATVWVGWLARAHDRRMRVRDDERDVLADALRAMSLPESVAKRLRLDLYPNWGLTTVRPMSKDEKERQLSAALTAVEAIQQHRAVLQLYFQEDHEVVAACDRVIGALKRLTRSDTGDPIRAWRTALTGTLFAESADLNDVLSSIAVFREAARSAVQPQPSLWAKTARPWLESPTAGPD